jgi:hypothetical protein
MKCGGYSPANQGIEENFGIARKDPKKADCFWDSSPGVKAGYEPILQDRPCKNHGYPDRDDSAVRWIASCIRESFDFANGT